MNNLVRHENWRPLISFSRIYKFPWNFCHCAIIRKRYFPGHINPSSAVWIIMREAGIVFGNSHWGWEVGRAGVTYNLHLTLRRIQNSKMKNDAVELTRTIVKCENELGELARQNNFCRLNKSKKFKYLICLYIFRLRNYNCNVLNCPLDSDSLCVTRPVTRGGERGDADGRWGIQSF